MWAFDDVWRVLFCLDFFNFRFEFNIFFDLIVAFGAVLVVATSEAGEFVAEAFDEAAQNVSDDE